MHSLAPSFLRSLRFSGDHIATLRALGEHRGKQALFYQQTPEALESLRHVAIVESSESSNRLEGIVAPHKRVEDMVLRSSAPRNRSEQEIAGYRDALGLIHECASEMALASNIVLQIHGTIYRYLPNEGGRWKMTNNEIVERDRHGDVVRVRFSPVSALSTPQAMETLVNSYQHAVNGQAQDALVIVPLTILDLLCIHPFDDGNGRTARLVTLLLLYHFGYEVGRYISLERIFEESKETYYETLERSSQGWHDGEHDVFPWMTYFWGTLIRAYDEFESRVGTICSGRGGKTAQVRAAVERRTMAFAISELVRDCPGVSRDMVRHVLRQMRDEGLVAVRGKGRAAKWRWMSC